MAIQGQYRAWFCRESLIENFQSLSVLLKIWLGMREFLKMNLLILLQQEYLSDFLLEDLFVIQKLLPLRLDKLYRLYLLHNRQKIEMLLDLLIWINFDFYMQYYFLW